MFTTFMVYYSSLPPLKGHFQKYLIHLVAKKSYNLVLYIYIYIYIYK